MFIVFGVLISFFLYILYLHVFFLKEMYEKISFLERERKDMHEKISFMERECKDIWEFLSKVCANAEKLAKLK
jgi:hypothetical protein